MADSSYPANRIHRAGHDLKTRLKRLHKFGNRPAYLWRDGVRWRSRSYHRHRARILACARRLHEAGVTSGTPVLIQGPNHPDWIEALLGTFLVGGVAVPLDEATPESFRFDVTRKVEGRHLIAPPDISPAPGTTRIDLGDWALSSPGDLLWAQIREDSQATAEVVFTSGTTGDPKGVVLTHGNLTSDFGVIERGFQKYESKVHALGTLRLLSTLPLSHMFGQAMNAFLAPYMGLTVVFVPPRPREILEAARHHRAWGLFTVPRVLDILSAELRRRLREEGCWEILERRHQKHAGSPFYLQALLFPRVRRQFGWRFRLLVSGGAALPVEIKRFWEGFGYLVVQGYGLTETAPIVSVSNPFDRKSESVGKPFGIQEVKLGPDGEVLVRGPNVTAGYYGSAGPRETDGWFHTGDVGEFDENGRLRIRGRLKDVIVTSEGENVHPADVEAAFQDLPGVRGACVVGLPSGGGERVHAVLITERGSNPEELVAQANQRLQPRQRVRDYSLWPGEDFPRTTTGKIRKGRVRDTVLAGDDSPGSPTVPSPASSVRRLIAQVARIRPERLEKETRLSEGLGLSSLDLVELAVSFEEQFGVTLPEDRLADATVEDLERAAREPMVSEPVMVPGTKDTEARASGDLARETATGGMDTRKVATNGVGPPSGPGRDQSDSGLEPGSGRTPAISSSGRSRPRGYLRMPRWAFRAPMILLRRILETLFYRPIVLLFARPRVTGLEHLSEASPPFLFVANHHSHLDAGLLWTVLPPSFRGRVATAMTTRYNRVFFGETSGSRLRYWKEGWQAILAHKFFGTWPLPETAGFRTSLSFAGELADRGISILIFPEGVHTEEGTLGRFREGIGIFARDLRVPVIPVYLEGTSRVLPSRGFWIWFGKTRIALGSPLTVPADAPPAETARRLEERVRALKEKK